MKKLYTTALVLSLIATTQAQTWTKVSGILDSSQVKGIGVINNQILVAGQNWLSSSLTDYALSNDGGNTWSKLPTYNFAGYLPNALPQNNLQICSNGFTSSQKLVGAVWQSFSGASNFAEFGNGSIIGSQGSFPDTVYNYSAAGVKGTKLGNYTFKLSSKYCAASNNRVFVFAYGVGLGFIDYSNLGVVNIPATLDGNAMTQLLWDNKLITNMIKTSNGNLFAIGDGVLKSVDNGVNWTTVLYLSGTPVTSIAKSSTDVLYILEGNAQVRKSIDLGSTFTNISGNLPTTTLGAFKKELFVNTSNELFCILNSNGGINSAKSGIYKLTNIIGINDIAKNEMAFSIYPNPSNKILNVNISTSLNSSYALNESVTIIEITDILGKTQLSKTITENTTQLNVNDFAKGIYFITVKSGNKMSTQKLMID
jgi:Secretion system C-terminal sorting domain